MININVGHNFNLDQEQFNYNQHIQLLHNQHLSLMNNEDTGNDTDIIDESDSDLEPSLNKVSTENSGLSDDDEEELSGLKYSNANILIKQQHFYQQQQQQHLLQFDMYNINNSNSNNQENEPFKPMLSLSHDKQNRAKSKTNKIKSNKNKC